jgi:hypothetical protein
MSIFYRSAKNRQVTHHYYGLSCILHAVSEFYMESFKFKGTNDEFKGENCVYF